MLAKTVDCPIYFVLGNHDIWFSSFEERYQQIRDLCKEYPNLIWMSEADVTALNDEVAIIGTDGWYDAEIGEPKYLKYSLDQFLIQDIRKLPYLDSKIEKFRSLADISCKQLINKLEKALELDYKTVYILTHMPPWKEATRDESSLLKDFWLPYNTNIRLGNAIEEVMQSRKKRNVVVLSGHTHHPEFIRISRNIHCQVGKAEIGKIKSQWIYI
jgi:predicted phosphohydrolase